MIDEWLTGLFYLGFLIFVAWAYVSDISENP
jgi:hypothetical protein